MEIYKYKQLKDKKVLKLERTGNICAITKPQFNPDTGEALEPIREYFDIQQLYDLKRQYEELLDNINEMIKDFEKMKS
jgi:hypothetical protein